MKDILKTVIAEQVELYEASLGSVPRDFPERLLASREVIVISGIRRCGKSTLLHQIRRKAAERDYYLNFDDERLTRFSVDDFQPLTELFHELFGPQTAFYFDEIQNVPGWERFIRRIHDAGNRVFVTGSNAGMLSRELGTRLTGRHIRHELHPFSFREFLRFKGEERLAADHDKTQDKGRLKALFAEYFKSGGFPAYLRSGDSDILKALFEGILYRDVMVRNNLTNAREFSELVLHLASNIGSLSSYNSLAKTIGVAGATTAGTYVSLLEDAYLLFQVRKYDRSVRKQIQNPRKIYFEDNALAARLGFRFMDTDGRFLENLAAVELRRRGTDLFYHSSPKHECDFVTREGAGITAAIQVCARCDSPGTRGREIAGLLDAMDAYALKEGMIVTFDESAATTVNGKRVVLKPAWQWLLE
jgi:predicted AAA+ superfamily ATPase